MCWWSRKEPIKKIAEKDIPVFKVLIRETRRLYSLYTRYIYLPRVVNTEKLGDLNYVRNKYMIFQGFHSYSLDCIMDVSDDILSIYDAKKEICIDWILNIMIPSITTVIADCTIPKGSEYYLNERGEYVSDKIIINSIRENVLEK